MEGEAKIIHTRAHASITRAARVEAVPILRLPEFDPVLPEHISVSWRYELGENAWQLTWMDITGPRIKKDGNPGERKASVLFSDRDVSNAPEWARKFMTETAPQRTPYER